MPRIHHPLTETHIEGPLTRRRTVRVESCEALRAHHIAHADIIDAAAPYAQVRLRPSGSFVLACFAGEGRILLDGAWQTCRPGMICLAPRGVLNAFHAVPGKRWKCCLVRYVEPPVQAPIVAATSPVKVRTDCAPLRSAIEGLHAETGGANDPRLVHHWVELIHGCVMRVARPWQVNERLWKLWEVVGAQLERPWTLADLAAFSHYSTEHLRRLCLRELGRTPMQQLAYMRMQRSTMLLENTADKLEVIARAVGYENAFVFSRTFKRWMRCSPSEYRGAGK